MSVDTMNEIRMAKTIQAGQQAVWEVWTQPEQMKHWCCPDPNGEVSVESDFRVGGGYRIVMTVEGAQHIAYGTYREIDAPNRVVYTWDWDDPDMSMGETLVTVDFRANGEATDVTLVHAGFPALEAKEQHQQGWDACVARFEAMFG